LLIRNSVDRIAITLRVDGPVFKSRR